MAQRGNPFETSGHNVMKNILTGTGASEFLKKSIQIGEDVCTEFRKYGLDEKSVKLFDVILKNRKSQKVSAPKRKRDVQNPIQGGFNVRQTRQSPKVKNEEIKKKKIGILRGCSISYLSHPWGKKKVYHKPRPHGHMSLLFFSIDIWPWDEGDNASCIGRMNFRLINLN